MADNYLEKKMEEHRAGGRCSSYRPRLTPRGNRPGQLTIDFTPCRLLIDDIDKDGMTGIARALAAAGFKVAFTLDDIHRGSKLATTLACSYIPPGMPLTDDAMSLVAFDDRIEIRRGPAVLRVNSPAPATHDGEYPPEVTTTVAWMAAMLANLNDFNENVFKNIKIEGDSL